MNIHHELNYVEFASTNLDETKRFYSEAFDWKFNDYGPDYVGIQRKQGDGECGGFFRADEVQSGGPLVILYSNNLEQSLEAVTAAGGTITKGIISFPGGRRFQFADPSGNELAVWSDAESSTGS